MKPEDERRRLQRIALMPSKKRDQALAEYVTERDALVQEQIARDIRRLENLSED